uniref:Serpentine Receptor, class H n=1 Tax=Panagrellus redivivus TaxID=6233 RepID=A0A7E4VL30_PANRE
MNSYRVLVLAYLPFSVLTTLTITLLVPIFDDPANPSNGYHFYDKLFNFKSDESVLNLVSQMVIYVFDMVITDLLLFMLIDRYGIVSKNVTTRPKWVLPFCYVTVTITDIFAMVIIIANIVLFVYYPNETHSDEYIIINKLLIPAAAFYQLSRIAGFIMVIWLNINFGKKYVSTASATVTRLHKMLTRSVIVNILCTAFFTRMPFLLITVAFAAQLPPFLILSFNVIIALKHCAFLGNMVTTLYFVIPYRKFILHLLRTKQNFRVVHPVTPIL